jgi:hypothetical protein
MMTEAQKRAIYAYRQRIKGTEQGEDQRHKHNEICKRAVKKRYDNNEEYRLTQNKSCLDNYYEKKYYSYENATKQFRKICV